ncbi:MAG: putative GTP-binding protein YjiA [Alphaproteobacteria bacterium MarineAlpha11_Bin1]|nr:MAG: putative GTP-binding protein YjiA [Alphaproteobacteria bacterium MarineAlpha11_Bin1]|tara:strand:+ start:13119 stop:14087 length:969 start_codon:yes stop_codon:yes gene_type:complete
MKRIPLFILTGFLGSGKTTLLNQLLRSKQMRGTAVLVNELGEIGIDHELVVGASDDILLLDGGCLCCRPQGTVTDGISRLLKLDPRPENIIIETSGAANPYPILENLSQYSNKLAKLSDPIVITALDSTSYKKTFSEFPEASFQVSAGDIIVITKTDVSPELEREEIDEEIRLINSFALISDTSEFNANDKLIAKFKTSYFSPSFIPHTPASLASQIHGEREFQTVGKQFCGYLNAEKVQSWIDKTLSQYGSNLLRVKGILHLEEVGRPVTLQCVRDHVFPMTELENNFINPGRNTITAIGWGMHHELISEAIDDLSLMARD